MGGISPLSISASAYAAPTPSTSSTGTTANDEIGPAATLELSTLQLQSQLVSTLFGGLSNPASGGGLGQLLDVRV